MIEKAANKVCKAINDLGFIEVVQVNFKSDQVGFTCRVNDEGSMLKVLFHLLTKEDGWQSHLCKKYFLRGQSMKFGWNLCFRSDDIENAADKIIRVLGLYKEQYLDPAEGDAVRFVGSSERNSVVRGKGATAVSAGRS